MSDSFPIRTFSIFLAARPLPQPPCRCCPRIARWRSSPHVPQNRSCLLLALHLPPWPSLHAHHCSARAGIRPVLAAQLECGYRDPWDRQAAARYLDSREVWWQSGITRKRTMEPFASPAIPRPPSDWRARRCARSRGTRALRFGAVMLASIEKRVHMWNEVLPSTAMQSTGPAKKSNRAMRSRS